MTGNRESWLQEAVGSLTDLFLFNDMPLPPVHVSTGWPSRGGTSTKRRVLGECWRPDVSEDGTSHIFINPMMDDTPQVLSVLTHELVHAWDGGESGHKGRFIDGAKAVGLTGPWTSTSAGPELVEYLTELEKGIGKYPHSKLTPSVQVKTQTTRMLKVICLSCGYTVRTTQKWLDMGTPTCVCGDEMALEKPK